MKCPKCNNELILEEDSFDHASGTKVINYYWCEPCGETFEIDEVEE